MGKKGKKKPASGDKASGDQEAGSSTQPVQPPATPQAQPTPQQPQQQPPPPQPQQQLVTPQPVATESEEQKQAGEGKGKRRRGKKQQTAEAAGGQEGQPEQPQQPQAQPTPKQQQQQPQPQPTPKQQQPQPQQQPQQPPVGRGQPQQQQVPGGRGQPQQQQAPGRGQPQQPQHQPPGRRQPQQPQQPPPGRGQPQQQQQQPPPGWGRGQPQQQQQVPPGRGQPQQQPPQAWGRGQPQQQPPPGWSRGQPQQQQPQQQPPAGWGRGQQQPSPQTWGRGQPQQQPPPGWAGQQQPPPAWAGQQQPPPGWAGQQQPPPGWAGQQQPPPGWAGQQPPPGWAGQQPPPGWAGQQPPRVRQTSEQSEGQRSTTTTASEGSGSFRGDTRERTLSPTSSVGSEQSRGRAGGRGGRGGRGQSPQPQQQQYQETPGRGRGQAPRGAPRGRGGPVQQPQQVHPQPQTSGGDVQQAVKKPSLKDMPLVPLVKKDTKSRGTLGKKIEVQTNHLELKVQPKYGTAIHYDVTITPDKPKRLMRRVWQEYCRQYIPNSQAAFDDVKNAYSPGMLPFGEEGSGEVQVAEDNESRPRTYKVVLKYAATVNLMMVFEYLQSGGRIELPQESLQCIDIVLRNVSAARFVRVGRSYFSQPDRIIELGDGLDLWHGHFQSAVLGWKPFLNIDVAHKGFPREQRVIDLMADMAQARPEQINLRNDARTEGNINRFLKGLKILYEIPRQPASRRTYRVNSMVQPPEQARFVLESGEQTTVQEYFQRAKNYTIQYRNLPCLWVGPRDKKIYLPPELCTIQPGQVINKKLNEIQTANMVRNAATSTNIRKDKIMRSLRQINFNADPCVRAFGLSVGNEFETIPARILDPPTLEYQGGTASPFKGTWRTDRMRFLQPESCDHWTVLNMSRQTRDEKIDEFVRMLQMGARQLGMNIGEVTRPFPKYEQRGADMRGLEQMFTRLKNMKLVFVVVPDFQADVYSKVKQVAELTVGCLTQCIKGKTMFRMNPATVGNILLKVNAKLNGLNHQIATMSRPACLNVPCMIMGADVTHPSPDQTDIPSVAAVAASYDANAAFKYNFCWRLQPARKEIIIDLENIVKQQLEFFYQRTKQKPRQIIFFRDGVSEGQFREVLNAEVQAMRNACGKMGDGSYKPKITFLVVQKRHHTRFFPKDGARFVYDTRNNNVPAGTLVDTDIIHPTAMEYYLVSHASIQGVARPTKYRVLWDDANMTHDEIQTLTYYLCHMFTRCNRSVSYPAPTYYAHLAAFRARVYLEGHEINLTNLQREQAMRRIKDELSVSKPMFFV